MFELSLDGLKTEVRAKLGSNLIRNPFFVKDTLSDFAAAWVRSNNSVVLGTPSPSGSCELHLTAGQSITQADSMALNSGNDDITLPEFAFTALVYPIGNGTNSRLILDILDANSNVIVSNVELLLGDGSAYYLSTTSVALPVGTKDFKVRLTAPGSMEVRLKLVCLTPGALNPSFFIQHAVTEADLQAAIGDLKVLVDGAETDITTERNARIAGDTALENSKHNRNGSETHTGDWTNTGNLTNNGNFVNLGSTTLGDAAGDALRVNATATFYASASFQAISTTDATLGASSGHNLRVNATSAFYAPSTFNQPVTLLSDVTIGDNPTDSLTVNSGTTFNGRLTSNYVPVNDNDVVRKVDLAGGPTIDPNQFVQVANVNQNVGGVKTFASVKSNKTPVDANDVLRKADLATMVYGSGGCTYWKSNQDSMDFNLGANYTANDFLGYFFQLTNANKLKAIWDCTIFLGASLSAYAGASGNDGNISEDIHIILYINSTVIKDVRGLSKHSMSDQHGHTNVDIITADLAVVLNLKAGDEISFSTPNSGVMSWIQSYISIAVLPKPALPVYQPPPLQIIAPPANTLLSITAPDPTTWTSGPYSNAGSVLISYNAIGTPVWSVAKTSGPASSSVAIVNSKLVPTWQFGDADNYTTPIVCNLTVTDNLRSTTIQVLYQLYDYVVDPCSVSGPDNCNRIANPDNTHCSTICTYDSFA